MRVWPRYEGGIWFGTKAETRRRGNCHHADRPFLLVNSINIPNNPIKQEGMANVLAQAKFVPIVMSAGVLILGAVLFLKQVGGNG